MSLDGKCTIPTQVQILFAILKYVSKLGQIYLKILTNIFVNEDKYICQLGELYFVILTKICTKTILCVKMVGAMSLDSQCTIHSQKEKSSYLFV